MRQGVRKLPVPNPHGGDIDWSLVRRLLDQFDIDPEAWDRV